LSLPPPWQDDLRVIALTNPTLPILLHHQGWTRPADETFAADLAALIHNADLPNLNVLASGFDYYLSDAPLQYPYDVVWAQFLQPQLSAFGAHRLAWGSDFPAARQDLTYTQSLEVVRGRADRFRTGELDLVLGRTLEKIRTRDARSTPSDDRMRTLRRRPLVLALFGRNAV
jgi:L-fuconolactonase